MNALRRLRATVADINRRYRSPRIEMSRPVRWSLMALRAYLLFLVALMVYRFITLVN
ncbi:MAG: hypothetical protein JSR54_01340 [Proteobacteria bacterium]|nr:hypothetical protein [Pseudomonadota bacterium]